MSKGDAFLIGLLVGALLTVVMTVCFRWLALTHPDAPPPAASHIHPAKEIDAR